MTVLSLFAIVLLPRQFHVAVVENHERGRDPPRRVAVPAYLVLINLFVVPIAIAGLLTFPAGGIDGDMFVLGAAAQGAFRIVRAHRLYRRPLGGDRDGDRRIGRARDHGVERHRDAARRSSAGRRRPARRAMPARSSSPCAASRSSPSFSSPTSTTARPAPRSSPPSACFRLPPSPSSQPAFFGGLIWRRGTARRRHRRHDRRHSGVGLYAASAEHFRHRHYRRAHRRRRAFGLACCARRLCSGSTCRRWCTASCSACSPISRSLSAARSLGRPSAIERVQADLFVPSSLAPIAPSFRLRRASVTVEELIADHRPLSRRGAHARILRQFRRLAPPHARTAGRGRLPAAAIRRVSVGVGDRRRVLAARAVAACCASATVSTKAALKLLDDANAAIHYNREILQTALDHVRQGIAVFDKELALVCWNRQFGEIFDLPHGLTRVGIALDEILRHIAGGRRSRATAAARISTRQIADRIARYTLGSRAVPRTLRRARTGDRSARRTACPTAGS